LSESIRERWTRAAEESLASFLESRKPSSDIQVVESADGSKTTTKRVRAGGAGDAAFLKMHLECLHQIERLSAQEQPLPVGEDDDETPGPPRESEDWRALLNGDSNGKTGT
jgi:hypothetical protein